MLYLDCGIGLTGKNATTMAHLEALLEFLGIAFVVMADWNATPDELREAGWLES